MRFLIAMCFLATSLSIAAAFPPRASNVASNVTDYVSAEFALPQCAQTDNAGDCQALVAFAYATKFQSWKKNDNWCLGDTICQWYAVTCTNNRVTSLNFNGYGNNNIVGKLPSQFAQLTELTKLIIEDNDFSAGAGFPDVVRNLTKLDQLSLAGNKISGPLPDWIGTLTSLSLFYAWGNALSGTVPGTLGNLKQLISLDIHGNQFTGVSNDVCNLPLNFFLTGTCMLENSFTCPLPFCVARSSSSNTVCDATCTQK